MSNTPWNARPGEALHIPSGPHVNQRHLFVIFYGPNGMPDYGPVRQLLLASVTTIRPGIGHDPACVIQPGEHPFVNERSYILYRDVRVVAENHAQHMVATQVWTPHSVPFSPELLAKVIAGAQTSKFMPREFRQFVS